MAGDANYANTSALVHGNGPNNSTGIVDNGYAGLVWTANGNAKISTAQSKFGGASMYFDGTGDYIDTPANAALNMGTGNFTIELWVRLDATGVRYCLLSQANSTAQNSTLSFHIEKTAANKIQAFCCSGSSTIGDITGGTSLAANTWYHVAYVRNGNNFNIYLNGTSDATTVTSSASVNSSANKLALGRIGEFNGVYLAGYLDDVRITKGVARYTGNFTAPAAEFYDWAGQIAGTVLDASAAAAARTVRAYRRDTGALVGSTTSSGSTGAYTINCPTLDECSVICLDDSGGTLENDLILRTTPA